MADIFDSIDVKLQIPKMVDVFCKGLGFEDADYHRSLLEGPRAHLRAILDDDESLSGDDVQNP